MKTLLRWTPALLALLIVAGPAFAQSKVDPKPAKMRHLTGEIVSVDDQAKTLKVKRIARGKESEYTFTADKDAAQALTGLKTGERVTVSYVTSAGKMTAEKIQAMAHAAASRK